MVTKKQFKKNVQELAKTIKHIELPNFNGIKNKVKKESFFFTNKKYIKLADKLSYEDTILLIGVVHDAQLYMIDEIYKDKNGN